jgi:hypothetical protein
MRCYVLHLGNAAEFSTVLLPTFYLALHGEFCANAGEWSQMRRNSVVAEFSAATGEHNATIRRVGDIGIEEEFRIGDIGRDLGLVLDVAHIGVYLVLPFAARLLCAFYELPSDTGAIIWGTAKQFAGSMWCFVPLLEC